MKKFLIEMSEDNNVEQNIDSQQKENDIPNEVNIDSQNESNNSMQNTNQNQDETQKDNLILKENLSENNGVPAITQEQSQVEETPIQQAPEPSLKDLKRQISVLIVRIEDANQHSMVREDNLRKSISSLTTQNALLRTHLKSLDQLIKKLSLLHSQLTAAPNYKLAKADVDEMIRLVQNL